ncbi:MAG TPA: hypothetical protein VI997_09145 [Candidatus Thermoplasmatota archaeon]|nr:hypothetical protein [Candidatus Thermoplasmatota archaeon]
MDRTVRLALCGAWVALALGTLVASTASAECPQTNPKCHVNDVGRQLEDRAYDDYVTCMDAPASEQVPCYQVYCVELRTGMFLQYRGTQVADTPLACYF